MSIVCCIVDRVHGITDRQYRSERSGGREFAARAPSLTSVLAPKPCYAIEKYTRQGRQASKPQPINPVSAAMEWESSCGPTAVSSTCYDVSLCRISTPAQDTNIHGGIITQQSRRIQDRKGEPHNYVDRAHQRCRTRGGYCARSSCFF